MPMPCVTWPANSYPAAASPSKRAPRGRLAWSPVTGPSPTGDPAAAAERTRTSPSTPPGHSGQGSAPSRHPIRHGRSAPADVVDNQANTADYAIQHTRTIPTRPARPNGQSPGRPPTSGHNSPVSGRRKGPRASWPSSQREVPWPGEKTSASPGVAHMGCGKRGRYGLAASSAAASSTVSSAAGSACNRSLGMGTPLRAERP